MKKCKDTKSYLNLICKNGKTLISNELKEFARHSEQNDDFVSKFFKKSHANIIFSVDDQLKDEFLIKGEWEKSYWIFPNDLFYINKTFLDILCFYAKLDWYSLTSFTINAVSDIEIIKCIYKNLISFKKMSYFHNKTKICLSTIANVTLQEKDPSLLSKIKNNITNIGDTVDRNRRKEIKKKLTRYAAQIYQLKKKKKLKIKLVKKLDKLELAVFMDKNGISDPFFIAKGSLYYEDINNYYFFDKGIDIESIWTIMVLIKKFGGLNTHCCNVWMNDTNIAIIAYYIALKMGFNLDFEGIFLEIQSYHECHIISSFFKKKLEYYIPSYPTEYSIRSAFSKSAIKLGLITYIPEKSKNSFVEIFVFDSLQKRKIAIVNIDFSLKEVHFYILNIKNSVEVFYILQSFYEFNNDFLYNPTKYFRTILHYGPKKDIVQQFICLDNCTYSLFCEIFKIAT